VISTLWRMDTPGLGFLDNYHATCTVLYAAFYET